MGSVDAMIVPAERCCGFVSSAPAADAFKLVGGDEYWWIGYPPIITVAPPAPPDAAPPEPDHFMGSFFEKAVALDGLSG